MLFVCGLPAILALGKILFGSWHGFFESLRFLLVPDIISILRGEWTEDQWATLKLFVFLFLCGGALYSAHRHFFPQ
ncbi:hypothetical protein EON83_29850 [bacterium]|nr:MAG: hypothetical protein EON83_29850 [bacterium]